jgi:hypothetical protein
MGRLVGNRAWSRLESAVWGRVAGVRTGVRVTFEQSVVDTFGSEAACVQWAKPIAMAAYSSVSRCVHSLVAGTC